MEFWTKVTGYEGLYEVSSFGNVRSLPRVKYSRFNKRGFQTAYTVKGKLLSPKVDKDGYLCVTLTDHNGVRLCHRINRLVAVGFIPKPSGKDVVHHIDENVQNNRAKNLMWVTQKENLVASDVSGKLSKQFSSPIICKTRYGTFVGEYPSVRKAGEQLNLDARHISAVLNGRRKHTHGFVFERIGG